MVTDFDSVAAATSDGTDTITVYGTWVNASTIISDVVVTLGAGQVEATIAPLSIANTDEWDFYDIYTEDTIDGATNSSSTGQVQLIRAIWTNKWEFVIANK
jgi:hypothetical protein